MIKFDMQRQEAFSIILADLLIERNIIAEPEAICYDHNNKKYMPDILVKYSGLKIIIEAEHHKSPRAKNLIKSIKERITKGYVPVAIGIEYPKEIRSLTYPKIKNALSTSIFRIAIASEYSCSDFISGNIDVVIRMLKSTIDHLINEDVVLESVNLLEGGLNIFSDATLHSNANALRLMKILGTTENLDDKKYAYEAVKISGLVLLNALIFQEILSENNSNIFTITNLSNKDNPINEFLSHWNYIVNEINYFPIFYLAKEIISCLSTTSEMIGAIKNLTQISIKIVKKKSALRHDLMGRIYHKLLAKAKNLGTYYTGVAGATLLLKLTMHNIDQVDWANLDSLKSLKIADLACGTGTLLMASAEATKDIYIDTCINNAIRPDIVKLERILTESIIHGYDILLSAIHLTASTLAMRSPATTFCKTNLHQLPLGGEHHRLGTIEFLKDNNINEYHDLFGTSSKGENVDFIKGTSNQISTIPMLDICAINPPFTRSVGGNLLFGSVDESNRKIMQKELASIIKKQNLKANTNAGLGSVFIAIADRYLKENGKLALVIPKAILSGIAWQKTRELIAENYILEYLISSHDPKSWSFSESTNLSEVLLIAKKKERDDERDSDHNTKIINLTYNPKTSFESLLLYDEIVKNKPILHSNNIMFGYSNTISWHELKKQISWMLPSAFAHNDLSNIVNKILINKEIPLVNLSEYGILGYDRRDIHDAFELSDHETKYHAFWGHNSKQVTSIYQLSNNWLKIRLKPSSNRPKKNPAPILKARSTILIAERLRLNTHKTVAIVTNNAVLANTWWTFLLREPFDKFSSTIPLWLNSTIGILTLLSVRQETEGAWIDFKKPTLENLPILNFNTLSMSQLELLDETYHQIKNKELKSISQISDDPIRIQIDNAFEKILNINLTPIRNQLSKEPILTLKSYGDV